MSSYTRRIQTEKAGLGKKLGTSNPKAKDLLARLKREERRAL